MLYFLKSDSEKPTKSKHKLTSKIWNDIDIYKYSKLHRLIN